MTAATARLLGLESVGKCILGLGRGRGRLVWFRLVGCCLEDDVIALRVRVTHEI